MPRLYVGLMSGTSLDGVDAALVEFESELKFTTLSTLYIPYPESIRSRLNELAQNNQHVFEPSDSELHTELASLYAQAVFELLALANLPAADLAAIANHGQTVRHEPNHPEPFSVQLGDGQELANLTGVRTISQFRQADLAAGGQGAPLMPAFHRAAFGQADHVAVVNIGGIANLSILKRPLIGFDTGPGNCLMDQWIHQCKGVTYDENGDWAASAEVDDKLLLQLLDEPFFNQAYPKSTGTDAFNLAWLKQKEIAHLTEAVVQRTLAQLTVESIARSLENVIDRGIVWVCGGGAANRLLMRALRQRLVSFDVKPTDAMGINVDFVEAVGFAWLGYCRDHNIVGNEPSVTGAKRQCVLGKIYEPVAP